MTALASAYGRSSNVRTALLVVAAFLFVFSVTEGQSAGPPTAEEVVANAETRYKSGVTNEDTTLSVRLIDDRGRENVRKLRLIVAYGAGGDGDKKLIRFLEPADVRGAGLLNLEHNDRADDQWLFLKSVGKARRIASSGRGERFIGTDYSIADTRSENTSQWTYHNLTEETLAFPPAYGWHDFPCYRVEAIPREGTETAYTRRLLWVHHELPIIVKEELYDRDGLMKTRVRWGFAPFPLDAGGTCTVLRAQFEEMVDERMHHRTVLEVLERHVNQDFPESTFTTRELEKGR